MEMPPNSPDDVFSQLFALIEDRKQKLPEKSYTTQLLTGGVAQIGAKVLEESSEAVEAASEPDAAGRDHFVREAADLLYHLFVLLAARNVPLSDVSAELARRFGISGLDEKAART